MDGVSDGPPACAGRLAGWAAERYDDVPAVLYRRDGGWRLRSYRQLSDAVYRTAAGLRTLGLGAGDRVGLLSRTRPEWTVFDLAVATLGAVCVPLHPEAPVIDCARVLAGAGARAVVCEDDAQRGRLATARGDLPDLRHMLLIEGESPAAISLTALRARSPRGDTEPHRVPAASCADPAGPATLSPGGRPVAHRTWRAALDAIAPAAALAPGEVAYLGLPLAHAFGRLVQLATFEAGGTLCYAGTDPAGVPAELAEVRPVWLPAAPRLFERAYATRMVPVGLGGRVRAATSWAGPVAPAVLAAFAAAGLPVQDARALVEPTGLVGPAAAAEPVVTTAGASIDPAGPEAELRRSRWVSHAYLHGTGRPYPVALLTLDEDAAAAWAGERGLPATVAALARHPDVLAAVTQVVDTANQGRPAAERIRRFALLGHDLSVEAGELTPTLGVRRAVVADRYGDVLDRLYAGGP
jgi:long-chain acyl-CoA synthetase